MDLERRGAGLRCTAEAVTLLDTNAVIWSLLGHPRSRPLARLKGRRYVSPATVLELQLLVEIGRIALKPRVAVADLLSAGAWLVDDLPSASWFDEATDVGWTRDPFDRLIVAHAMMRGWRLATGDSQMLEQLGSRLTIEL